MYINFKCVCYFIPQRSLLLYVIVKVNKYCMIFENFLAQNINKFFATIFLICQVDVYVYIMNKRVYTFFIVVTLVKFISVECSKDIFYHLID